MTLERILEAAVNSMIHGHHAPHCYFAWVQGRGYVNDGSAVFDRADYLRQLERDARSEVGNMMYTDEYAGRGYKQPRKGILAADWNKLPRNLDRILERAGFAVEWSDEWAPCDACNKAIRTEPDGYYWEPEYHIDDGDVLCRACYADEHANDETEGE